VERTAESAEGDLMKDISRSVPKRDHYSKISGGAMYVCDYPTDDILFGRLLRSTVARGIIRSVKLPELPVGYWYFDSSDVPGINEVHIVQDDTPVFADNTVEHIGDPIGMIAGPDEREVGKLLRMVKVEYDELEPIFSAQQSDVVFFDFNIEKVCTSFNELTKNVSSQKHLASDPSQQ